MSDFQIPIPAQEPISKITDMATSLVSKFQSTVENLRTETLSSIDTLKLSSSVDPAIQKLKKESPEEYMSLFLNARLKAGDEGNSVYWYELPDDLKATQTYHKWMLPNPDLKKEGTEILAKIPSEKVDTVASLDRRAFFEWLKNAKPEEFSKFEKLANTLESKKQAYLSKLDKLSKTTIDTSSHFQEIEEFYRSEGLGIANKQQPGYGLKLELTKGGQLFAQFLEYMTERNQPQAVQ